MRTVTRKVRKPWAYRRSAGPARTLLGKFSGRTLADQVGLSPAQVYKVLAGKGGLSEEAARRWAGALKISRKTFGDLLSQARGR